MKLTSAAFSDGDEIPSRFTCDGANVAPNLAWSDLPAETGSLAVHCFDPDAPDGTFTHWTLWDLDPSRGGLSEGGVPPDARQGRNDSGEIGYGGPCPPKGHGAHRYHFRLSALRQPLDIDEGCAPDGFIAAIGRLRDHFHRARRALPPRIARPRVSRDAARSPRRIRALPEPAPCSDNPGGGGGRCRHRR
jgi:Raf kinase inhibitor-like YbhB/YbcL family protein